MTPVTDFAAFRRGIQAAIERRRAAGLSLAFIAELNHVRRELYNAGELFNIKLEGEPPKKRADGHVQQPRVTPDRAEQIKAAYLERAAADPDASHMALCRHVAETLHCSPNTVWYYATDYSVAKSIKALKTEGIEAIREAYRLARQAQPTASKWAMRKMVAAQFGVSPKTVERYTAEK